MIITCSSCDASWTGLGRCHHAKEGCHETFGGRVSFDLHLRANGTCLHPSALGLKQNDNGVWVNEFNPE